MEVGALIFNFYAKFHNVNKHKTKPPPPNSVNVGILYDTSTHTQMFLLFLLNSYLF
jgi:hypothetical protein